MNLDQLQKEVMSLTDHTQWKSMPEYRTLLLQRITLLLEIEKVKSLLEIKEALVSANRKTFG